MKDVLENLFAQLRNANGPTRVVVAAAVIGALIVAGIASFRASSPHFVLLDTHPDASQLPAVQAAIAGEEIRFRTSAPPGPYSLWVEEEREYEARNAIALSGAMTTNPRGIRPSAGGASSVFMGAGEREQQMLKRKWEETEKQLEIYAWISKATVTSSSPPRNGLGKPKPATVSVVLQLRGTTFPDREQCDTVATIVRSAFDVPQENLVISDHLGRRLYDGTRDRVMDGLLVFQDQFDSSQTKRAQALLDEVFGPGLAFASVHGVWSHDRVESVDEALDPSTKVPISKSSMDTTTPASSSTVGGPAGVSSNLSTPPAPAASEAAAATTSETQEDFLVGRRTTHRLQGTPLLERLTVTLLLDESIKDQLTTAEGAVKATVGFDESRGDFFTSNTARFSGLERDEEGQLVVPEPLPVPEPVNPTVEKLIERGAEILAALAFLFVLFKSLKSSKRSLEPAASEAEGTSGSGVEPEDEEVDLDLLARRRVEDLLENQPEKVSALLSRWALSDRPFGS